MQAQTATVSSHRPYSGFEGQYINGSWRPGRGRNTEGPGLSAHVAIAHREGDQAWAERTAREMESLETRHNASEDAAPPAVGGEPRAPSGPAGP
jgi:hypothetical protein